MKSSLYLAASALAVAVVGSPASAREAVVTYTGTVSEGFDQSGRFGAAETSLAGAAFISRYVFDLTNYVSFGGFGETFGSGAASPSISASITINGLTTFVKGDGYSILNSANFNGTTRQSSSVSNEVPGVSYQFLQNEAIASGTSFPATNGYFSGATTSSYNSAFFEQLSADGGQTLVYQNYAALSADSFTVAVSAVPEPATWAMMILGMGAVGFAMRRRSVTTTVSYG